MKQTIQVDLNRWLEKKEGGRGLDGATSSGIRIDNTWPVGNQSDFICCRLLSDVIRLSRRNIPTIPHPFNFDQLNDVTISSKCFNFVENEMKSIDNFFFILIIDLFNSFSHDSDDHVQLKRQVFWSHFEQSLRISSLMTRTFFYFDTWFFRFPFFRFENLP